MNRQAINQAMNAGARRLAKQVRLDEPGSWTRLLTLATSRSWADADLVSLLTVAYEIGHDDGERCAEAYPDEP